MYGEIRRYNALGGFHPTVVVKWAGVFLLIGPDVGGETEIAGSGDQRVGRIGGELKQTATGVCLRSAPVAPHADKAYFPKASVLLSSPAIRESASGVSHLLVAYLSPSCIIVNIVKSVHLSSFKDNKVSPTLTLHHRHLMKLSALCFPNCAM